MGLHSTQRVIVESICAVIRGYADASERYSQARGERLQRANLSILTGSDLEESMVQHGVCLAVEQGIISEKEAALRRQKK